MILQNRIIFSAPLLRLSERRNQLFAYSGDLSKPWKRFFFLGSFLAYELAYGDVGEEYCDEDEDQ